MGVCQYGDAVWEVCAGRSGDDDRGEVLGRLTGECADGRESDGRAACAVGSAGREEGCSGDSGAGEEVWSEVGIDQSEPVPGSGVQVWVDCQSERCGLAIDPY